MPPTPFYQLDQRDGTSQAERFFEALADGYFDVDERSEAQLLGLAQAVSRNLKYRGLDGHDSQQETWADLLAHDPVFVLADITNTNTKKLERVNRVLRQDLKRHGDLIELLHGAVTRWHQALRRTQRAELKPLASAIRQFLESSLDVRYSKVGKLLAADAQQREALLRELAGKGKKNVPQMSTYLEESVHQYIGAIDYFKTLAATAAAAKATVAEQNPAVSLYVTFLRLYSRVQQRLNAFSRRRIDFYYETLLGAQRQSVQPDRVHLALTLTPGLPPTTVPKGTQFLAGRDADENDIVFLSDEDNWLTDNRVADVRILHLERDEDVSPHGVLGCVTRASVRSVSPTTGSGDERLFGGGQSGEDARIGLAVSSRLLEVAEGMRRITLNIACRNPSLVEGYGEIPLSEDSAEAIDQLLALTQSIAQRERSGVRRPADRRRLERRLGQILAREVIGSDAWLSASDKDRINDAVVPLLGLSCEIPELLQMDRAALFYRMLRDALDVRLTGAEGWVLPADVVLQPLEAGREGPAAGISLVIELPAAAVPVVPYDPQVHGGELPVAEATLSLCISPRSAFYAYSLLSALDIEALDLGVEVRGARRLSVSGDLGPLDASKPFVPFGPQPGRDAFLAVGLAEAATKPLAAATLNIEWSGLPQDFGGFESHYQGYPSPYNTQLFLTRASVLESGGWRAAPTPQPLFQRSRATGQICADITVDLLHDQHFTPLLSVPEAGDFRLDHLSQGGFFRLDLSPCDNGFGHAEYPQVLTQVLMANARRRKPVPAPNLPYTPMISSLTMDYAAHESVRLRVSSDDQPEVGASRAFHLHPFGVREVMRHGRNRPVALMPSYLHDGYLLLGLAGQQSPGTVSLLFELAGGKGAGADDDLALAWYYVTGNELRPLPRDAVLRDTTADMTASGVVTVAVPEDIDRQCTVLPTGKMWLAIAARGDLASCPKLRHVATGAVQALREPSASMAKINAIAAGTIAQLRSALPAVASVSQPANSFGGHAAEDRAQAMTRIAERLHHKNRACQPWDYERLVLEQFPELHKVKCFANMRTDTTEPAPGHVLVVVVPKVTEQQRDVGTALVSPGRLREIEQFLVERATAFATVTVRNAAFEHVQIRCSVKFRQRGRDGYYIRELQRRISQYISPWQPGGYGADFGWRIRRKDIEACIGASPDVAFVTDFSMLHITRKSASTYGLKDTARGAAAPGESGSGIDVTPASEHGSWVHTNTIKPRYPWSLALPSRQHYIRSIDELTYIRATATGVGELEIGNTLILDSEHHSG